MRPPASEQKQTHDTRDFSRPAPLSRCIDAGTVAPPRAKPMGGRLAACLLPPLRASGPVVQPRALFFFGSPRPLFFISSCARIPGKPLSSFQELQQLLILFLILNINRINTVVVLPNAVRGHTQERLPYSRGAPPYSSSFRAAFAHSTSTVSVQKYSYALMIRRRVRVPGPWFLCCIYQVRTGVYLKGI